MRVRNVDVGAGRGWPAAGRRTGRAARRRCAAIADDLGAAGRCPRPSPTARAAGPSGQPSVSSCRRAAASRSTRVAEAVRAPARSSRRAGSAAAPGRRRCSCRRRPGRRCRAGSRRAPPPPRAGWAARCAAGRPAPRAMAAGRRSASSTISTMSSAVCATSASQTVTPSRPGRRGASSSVWPKVGRPAPTRTASARPARSAAASSCGCADSQATTRAVRQVLAPPLRQQRGLAEAGRRLHQDHRAVAQALGRRLQARPRDQVARHARRRDLEQQVVGGAGTARAEREWPRKSGQSATHGCGSCARSRRADAHRNCCTGVADFGPAPLAGGEGACPASPPSMHSISCNSTEPPCTAICSFPSTAPTSRWR